jgi:hypothetical protein
MPKKNYSTSKEICKEIELFFTRDKEFFDKVTSALIAIERKGNSYDKKVEMTAEALVAFWENVSQAHIAKIFANFPKIEKALFGLERNEDMGERYRDHFLHMFHNFILGCRIFSQIPSKQHPSLFKIQEEKGVPFGDPYNPSERLYFVWALITMFEDVGIPIEHLSRMQTGINEFLEHFGLKLMDLPVQRNVSTDSNLHRYFRLMSQLFDSGIIPEKGGYRRSLEESPYMYNALSDGLDKNDHAVLGAIALYRSIEETFLKGRNPNPKYDFTLAQCKQYVSSVLEQDITRAALAVAFHNINPEQYPKVFPIEFDKFPLTFLKILCDETQEYFRLEGVTHEGVMPLESFPRIAAKIKNSRLEIDLSVQYKITLEIEKAIMPSLNAYQKRRGIAISQNFEGYLDKIWFSDKLKVLKKKLAFGKDKAIVLRFCAYAKRGNTNHLFLIWDSDTQGS